MLAILLLLGTVLLGCTPQIVIGGIGRGECPASVSDDQAKWQQDVADKVNQHEQRLADIEKLFAK